MWVWRIAFCLCELGKLVVTFKKHESDFIFLELQLGNMLAPLICVIN